MIRDVYQYNGAGRPVAKFDVHGLFSADWMRVVVMSPEEEEFYFALQLVHGAELKLINFQDFHDYGWANPKQNPLDLYMKDVACTNCNLTDLMMNPRGDLLWQRELAKQKKPLPFDADFQPFITRNLF